MLIGTIGGHREVSKMIAHTDIPKRLGDVLLQKDMGEDITLQILYSLTQ